jgi:electron transport complex protein RnfD
LPLWAAALGAVVAISLGKQVFGGLGYNIFNPALVGRAFLQSAFPVLMANWEKPLQWLSATVDTTTMATPLALMKFETRMTPYLKLFSGNVGGTLGETSALALLVGGIFLLYKRYIEWRIPLSFLGTVALLSGLLWIVRPHQYGDPLFQLLAGGLILGAFFMATDPVTAPITVKGYWIFGIGAGVLVVTIRCWGGLAEGVMYAILLMNAVTPLINRYTRPAIFGKNIPQKKDV